MLTFEQKQRMLKDYDEFEELIYYPNEKLKDLLENKIFQVALNSPGLIFFAIFTWKIYLNNEILMENRTRLIMIEMWLINFLTILDLVINAIYEADTYFMDSEGIIREFITRCTPVPSCESTLLENEANRKIVIISSEKEAESGSENDLTLSSNCCLDSSLYFQYCIPIHIFFMQRRIGSTEMTSDEKLRLPLKYMIRKVGTKIKNRFSFYVFASIFEIRWNRAKNAMMKKARDSNNIFRKLLAPNSVDLSLVDLMKLMELDEIPNNLNLYVFIRNVDEMELLDSPDSNAWRFDHVLESGK